MNENKADPAGMWTINMFMTFEIVILSSLVITPRPGNDRGMLKRVCCLGWQHLRW